MTMREIDVKLIEDTVAELVEDANLHLPDKMRETIEAAVPNE